MNNRLKKIVIVGGGTSGWMAAISLSSHFPDKQITVVDPASIAPIGVGEATTGVVQRFVRDPIHGLRYDELFRQTDATLKLGVWYRGWQGHDTDYRTPIDAPFRFFKHSYCEDGEDFYALAAVDGARLGKLQIHAILMRDNKTDFIRRDDGSISDEFADPSCHFDALKFARWLKQIAPTRKNIMHVDDVMQSFDQDSESGLVTKLVTQQGQQIFGDFFLDCTGFHRMLLPHAYAPQWVDYSRHIKVDTAVPFFSDYQDGEDLPVYTEALAMPHGWMWRLPTQSRLGHGYVYSSKYADDAAVVDHLRSLGANVGDPPQFLRFQPGRFDPQWQGNVCALGLAGGFIEPLEATTIHVTHVQIQALTELYLPFYRPQAAPALANDYNRLMQTMYDDFVDYISIHYHAGRGDTEFWRDYQKENAITDTNRARMEKWKYRFPLREDLTPINTARLHLVAGMPVWMPTLCGMGYLKKETAENLLGSSRFFREAQANVQNYLRVRNVVCSRGISHRDALAHLCGYGPAPDGSRAVDA